MKRFSTNGLSLPRLAMGCMRIADLKVDQLRELIEIALAGGMDMFDHADFYGDHQSEVRFGEVLKEVPSLRSKMIVQSKCGIRTGFYDSSYEHIMTSAENSLRKLHVDYLDAMLIHRPDVLVDVDEVARAFEDLEKSGKVKYFGVSNHNPMQIEVLQQAVKQPLLFNQMQLSLVRTGMIDHGVNVNTDFSGAVDRDGSVLDYCKLCKMVLQVWSPFQHGFIEGVFLNHPQFPKVNQKLDEMAEKYGVSKTVLAVAWLLRIPMMMQVIVGTTNPVRLQEIIDGADLCIDRQDWYELYKSAGNTLP